MSKKAKISTMIIILALAVVGGVLYMQENKTVIAPEKEITENAVVTSEVIEEIKNNQEETEVFVVDVDPNLDHWQTKKTDLFTVKFPKEWYQLGSVITNNPNFDIAEHAEIGTFSDIGSHSPLTFSNDTEIVIAERGKPTSNAGSPIDSLNSTFSLAEKNNPSVSCVVVENLMMPLKAYCSVEFNDSDMKQQSYYIINEELALTFTAWTTQRNDKNLIDILEKIAESYSY